MDELREQCPWDKKQTIHTLRKLTIEETYELSGRVISFDWRKQLKKNFILFYI